jgi:large subunit ribosomal protein L29
MPNQRAIELRDYEDDALLHRLAEEKDALFKLRFQLATGQQENTAEVSRVKRDIARILTELREREIKAAEALEEANQ